MLTVVVALVFAVTALAALLFAVVVVGIRNEPHTRLRSHAPSPLAAMSRRMLGVYVPTSIDPHEAHEEVCLTSHATTHREEGDVH